ncbi:type VII secretion protein EccB [Kitasatospora sp. NPDC096147]|uniref:type VII secretion protein EccB n=1 Tax=Kitasatospora sp. NPDC096147 TaxID=3364093 RepID=UPI003824CB29
MASRRDELNAYTSARKRTVGAFLLPEGGGNDEDAPRPVKAVLPSVVVAAVIVAGFAMWGVLKPAAPKDWDSGANIIQGKQSTTRYVILPNPKTKEKELHQVLNMSSARLVLPAGAKVVIVADKVLDAYKNHGATIGIPYAPDKLPADSVASKTKLWTVCNKPAAEDAKAAPGEIKPPNQAVFVAADKDAEALRDPARMLGPGQMMYVQGPKQGTNPGSKYLIDNKGYLHYLGGPSATDRQRSAMEDGLFGSNADPQQVTQEWLDTLEKGNAVEYKRPQEFETKKGQPSTLPLDPGNKKVGRLVSFQNRSFFMVGTDKLHEMSAFQSKLIVNDLELRALYGDSTPKFAELTPSEYAGAKAAIDEKSMQDMPDLPDEMPQDQAVNFAKERRTLCSTYEGMDGKNVKRSVWAAADYPAPILSGAASARVSPGHGLLFRAMDTNGDDTSGSNFLITETGLRYSVPTNNDGGKTAQPGTEQPTQGQPAADPKTNETQARLGYEKVTPVPVPIAWAKLVPAGPVLNTAAALQAQIA